jgi:deoxyribonuclease (pyrimidine dimer)
MTRINADYELKKLMDQHLMAEYRELPMVIAALKRSLRTQPVNTVLKKIPNSFTLNSGHVTFFYNKLTFLSKRYDRLVIELKERGYKLDGERKLDFTGIPEVFFRDWQARDKDNLLVEARINEKIQMKPQWYKYYGKSIVNK